MHSHKRLETFLNVLLRDTNYRVIEKVANRTGGPGQHSILGDAIAINFHFSAAAFLPQFATESSLFVEEDGGAIATGVEMANERKGNDDGDDERGKGESSDEECRRSSSAAAAAARQLPTSIYVTFCIPGIIRRRRSPFPLGTVEKSFSLPPRLGQLLRD